MGSANVSKSSSLADIEVGVAPPAPAFGRATIDKLAPKMVNGADAVGCRVVAEV